LEESLKDNGEAPLEQQIEAIINLGDAHFGTKDLVLAKKQYEKALILSKKITALQSELNIRLKLGRIAESENRFDEAYALYDVAKESALENGFNTLYFEGTILMGKLLHREQHYESAIIALSVAYINAIQRDNLNYQQQILEVQAKTFAATEDYKNAYAIMTQLAWVESEINTRQQQKIIKELEVEYETLKKEKEILGLQETQILKDTELKRQRTIRNAFLIGFLIILVPIIALLYVYYQKIQTQSELSKKQEEINGQKVASLVREQEMKVIRATLDGQDEERKRIAQELHDSIGGNLAGIKLQLSGLDNGSGSLKTISRQLDETYQLVRDISHTLIPKKFRQHRFTQIVSEYLNSISGTGAVHIHFHPHPPEEINTLWEEVQSELFKIIQELTTNTLKHAQATKLEIHLNSYNGSTNLLFEDDGRGFDPDKNEAGIGLKNLRDRVAELQGKLHIDTKIGRGTVISIEIPTKERAHEI
jgi:signal transduction histidine kinase